jgi:RNA polymerase sigma-70 factor (ECF subfamily)
MNCLVQDMPAPHLTDKELVSLRDSQLVSAARSGSSDAFAELQRFYSRNLYRTIYRITKNREDAEDVLQETFLRAYLALDAFEGRSTFYSWLTRIAINTALMLLRKHRVRCEVSYDHNHDSEDDLPHLEIRDSGPDPEQIYVRRQRYAGMLLAIENLEPMLRGAVQIQMADECTLQEIARTLDISVSAVKTRLHRARVQLNAMPCNFDRREKDARESIRL